MEETIRRFSQSEMKTFLRCRRKWWLSEYRRLAPKGHDPTGPLRSGTRVHTAMEAFYTPGEDPMEALAVAQAEDWQAYVNAVQHYGDSPDQGTTEQFAKDCELERAMVEGYGDWIAESGADAGLTLVSTEEIVTVEGESFTESTVDQFGPFNVVGKMDQRVRRDMDGARLFLDHKTAQSVTIALPLLQTDPQMLHYHWLEAMSHDGGWCDGALYNVIKKVKRTKAAKPPFYARYEVHHNSDEIENYELRMTMVIEEIFRMENRLAATPKTAHAQVAYPTPTRDCSWDCPFFTACPAFDDGSRVEDMLRDQFRERDPLARYAEGEVKGV